MKNRCLSLPDSGFIYLILDGIKDNSKRLLLHASYIELKEYKDRRNAIFKSNIPRDFNFYKKEDNR